MFWVSICCATDDSRGPTLIPSDCTSLYHTCILRNSYQKMIFRLLYTPISLLIVSTIFKEFFFYLIRDRVFTLLYTSITTVSFIQRISRSAI